jgi:hypothetical protein
MHANPIANRGYYFARMSNNKVFFLKKVSAVRPLIPKNLIIFFRERVCRIVYNRRQLVNAYF